MFIIVASSPDAPYGEVYFTGRVLLQDDDGCIAYVPDVSSYPEDAFAFANSSEPHDVISRLDLRGFRVEQADMM